MYVTRKEFYELKVLNENNKPLKIWDCETKDEAIKIFNKQKARKIFWRR